MVRRSRNEIERLVVDAAVDLVRLEGVGTGLEGITYTRVFRHLQRTTGQRVTRASVHDRLWPDQAAFQAAVRDRIAALDQDVIDLTALDDATDRAREAMLGSADVHRVLGSVMRELASIDAAEAPTRLRQANLAVKALVALADDDDQARAAGSVEAFRSAQQRRLDILRASYARTIRRLGGSLRPSLGLTEDEAVALIVCAIDGLSEGRRLRRAFDDHDVDAVEIDIDGSSASWPLTSIVGYALVSQFFDFAEVAVPA
ncbi:MAG: hypothetical protein R2733_15785 [Acidimicrobiales bacterium]